MKRPARSDKEPEPPWLVFRYCKDKCLACKQCGWFWGPSHPRAGEPTQFGLTRSNRS